MGLGGLLDHSARGGAGRGLGARGALGRRIGGGGSWNASGWRGGSASGGEGPGTPPAIRGGSASGGGGYWSATGTHGGTRLRRRGLLARDQLPMARTAYHSVAAYWHDGLRHDGLRRLPLLRRNLRDVPSAHHRELLTQVAPYGISRD